MSLNLGYVKDANPNNSRVMGIEELYEQGPHLFEIISYS